MIEVTRLVRDPRPEISYLVGRYFILPLATKQPTLFQIDRISQGTVYVGWFQPGEKLRTQVTYNSYQVVVYFRAKNWVLVKKQEEPLMKLKYSGQQ
jgi:trehalose utilization protein